MDFRREARRALAEDGAARDITSRWLIPRGAWGRARVVAKASGVLAGGPFALAAFREQHPGVRVKATAEEGCSLAPGRVVLEARGPLRALLSAERSALNFLTHLSGIATLTRRFVVAAGPRGPAVLDTRKTLPGLRDAEKYAVRCGGGTNHRRDLSSAVLIKENHLAFYSGSRGRRELIRRVRRARALGKTVEMESRDRSEVLWALEAGVDILLLDNVPLGRLPALVRWVRAECRRRKSPSPLLEVSGGVTLKTMPRLVRAKVDRVSVGLLTHSAPALDMSLEIETV